MSQKRNRSINWDEEEKQLFRAIFKEYSQIIENKSLDTNTNKQKTKAWEQFHKKFNELNSRPRELSQLKIQWKSMKVYARKTYSAFKKDANKTGGGTRPATPNEAVIEINDLLNPAELLRDHNIYDSDGLVTGEIEFPTNSNIGSQNTETIEDDDEVAILKFTPVEAVEISQTNTIIATPIENNIHSIPVKVTEEDIIKSTPIKNRGTTPATKVAKRKINNITNSGMHSKKVHHEDYVNNMLSHSKMLKDEEHMRRMEMAEEEHAVKMAIHREKLKSAILEREFLELKKAREAQ